MCFGDLTLRTRILTRLGPWATSRPTCARLPEFIVVAAHSRHCSKYSTKLIGGSLTTLRENCTTVNCNHSKTHKVMMHALVLPEIIMTEKGTREYETSLTHGVLRALMQSSGVRQKCPECKDYTSLLRTKLVETITLPRRLAVALDSGGRLCNEDPPVSLDICDGRAYVLVGIAIRNSAHYRCNVRIGDGWYHYDDGGGSPKPVFFPITSPSYVPFPSYKRRMLYYSLRSDAPVRGAQLRVPPWMAIRGGTEGDNCQEELVE